MAVRTRKKRETFEEVFTEAGIIPEWIEREFKNVIVQGLEDGRVEGREKNPRNLIGMGMPIEDIAKVTELPVERIN
jgi:hypothetical protein